MKTYSPKPEHIEHRWYVMDASGQVLGRLATEVATLLRGKHKPMWAPHMDTGDHVIVINADKVELTGNKAEDKIAYTHSGYPGGIRGVRYGELIATRPIAAIERAVRGMLPKNSIGRQMIRKLHVVPGPVHPHSAQKPVSLAVGERPAWDGLPSRADTTAPATKPASAPDSSSAKPKAPATEPTAAKKPAARKPAARKPAAAKKPTAAKLPAADSKPAAAAKPAAKKPTSATKPAAAKKPAAKKPTAKKPAPKKPTSDEKE